MIGLLDLPHYLTIIDRHWNIRKLGDWHAYGFRQVGDEGFIATAFFEPGAKQDIQALRQDFATERLEPPEIVQTARFQQMHNGSGPQPSISLAPGGPLFTTSPQCPPGCNGTLGAFVTPVAGDGGETWMLSNHHILAERTKCLKGIAVRGTGGKLVSQTVKPVNLKPRGNPVDAAIAQVSSRAKIRAVYPNMDIRCPTPIWPSQGLAVQKLGNATNVTSGVFVWCCPKVFVLGCTIPSSIEFTDQLIIASRDANSPFLAQGDSGSLVVGSGHPIGLLFAISDHLDPKAPLPPLFPPTLAPPFGLANPFQAVLDNLPKDDPSQMWRMILDPSHTCTDPHDPPAAKNCAQGFVVDQGEKGSARDTTASANPG
jgi:hypothetical protein